MIGPSFPSELAAAGLTGLPFSWTPDGSFTFSPEMIETDISAVQAVYAKHSPSTPTTSSVDVERDKRLAKGYVDAVTGKTYQCDQRSQVFLTAIGASAGLSLTMSPQPAFPLITADNSVVNLSATDAYSLINGRVMPWVSQTVLYARTLKDQIVAGTPPADITQGWPPGSGASG
jgi:hypothetical protein